MYDLSFLVNNVFTFWYYFAKIAIIIVICNLFAEYFSSFNAPRECSEKCKRMVGFLRKNLFLALFHP